MYSPKKKKHQIHKSITAERTNPSAVQNVDMNLKTIIPIISILSVAVMVLWGFLGNGWNYSWLAVFVGGVVIAILSIIDKNKKQ